MNQMPVLGGRWRLWEQFALRGPGFPVGGLSCLVPEGVAAGADKFVVGEVLSGPGWDAFVELFGQGAVATARGLQVVASSSGFRAAVGWQNRAVLESGVRPFLGWVPSVRGRTSMPRQREELVAHYWQRFCVKNDTIGFFGPVGWGRWDVSGSGLVVEPGEGLVAGANVYFASWAVDALARVLGQDPGLRVWVAPRRVPYVRVTDAGVVVPGRGVQPVEGLARWVLQRCDGVTAVAGLAVGVSRMAGRPVSVDEVVGVLGQLAARRWVWWRLEVPTCTYPERRLREVLQRVGDPVVRERALVALDRLERARAVVAECWDDPDRLNAALAELEAVFVGLTDTAASRGKAARTAPCRSLVYLDTRRSATARVGTTILNELPPLGLLLRSAAWLTTGVAAEVMERATEVFRRLAVERGGRVDLASFWFECLPVLHGVGARIAGEVQREFQRRWQQILGTGPGVRRIRRTAEEIAPGVHAAFDERGCGWSAARYASPDIMVAATDTAAVARGDFQLVLGELHLASNTLDESLFVNQHPAPEELFALTDLDHPGPRLLPTLAKEHRSRLSVRVRSALVRPQDYLVALLDDTADPYRPRTVRSADATVTEYDGRLVVELGDGATFAAVDIFGHVLTTLTMDLFRILPEADHTPRVTIDKMVIARETWRFDPADITFAAEKNEARRYVRARWWRATHELPRHIFVTSASEPRPFHVDFDSPVSVNILAKAIRRLARTDAGHKITVTEMLPTPEHAWLVDDKDNAYTAELRLVAVDQTTCGP